MLIARKPSLSLRWEERTIRLPEMLRFVRCPAKQGAQVFGAVSISLLRSLNGLLLLLDC